MCCCERDVLVKDNECMKKTTSVRCEGRRSFVGPCVFVCVTKEWTDVGDCHVRVGPNARHRYSALKSQWI